MADTAGGGPQVVALWPGRRGTVGPVAREITLDNGLKVILKAVQTAPVISTWLWYRVGSRDEIEGSTGLSHWVEHMLFKGSSRFPKGSVMRNVQRYGGYNNAMTSHDFTTYYETLPSNRAELALDIEADRMTTALFDPEEVERERTVIISEREGAENEPYYVLMEEMTAAAFRIHPYHHQTIGWRADLLSITRDQLYDHYRQYYVPNNAVLVAVGNLDIDAYLRLVEQYFGGIPAGELPTSRVRQEMPQRGERRVTLRMPGFAPMVRLAFHAPPVSHADYIPLVVAESLLSGGQAMFSFGGGQTKSARLYRALVETELASSVGSSYYPSVDPYLFSLGGTVREGRTPDEVEAALSAEIERLQREPVESAELAVAIRQTQAQFAYNSESATDQALTLGFLEMMDDHTRMDRLLDELAQVTPEDVARVAQTYLVEDNRIAGRFLPTDEGEEGAPMEVAEHNAWASLPARGIFCFSQPWDATVSPDTVVRTQLDNQVVVLVKENPASASVYIEGSLKAGAIHDSQETAGLANMTAAMLMRDTKRHTFQEINRTLDNVGASLDFGAGRHSMSFGGQSLAEDFGLLVDLMAEVLLEPTFPRMELEKLRGQALTHLGILDTDTGYRADRAFMTALYPSDHPYARSVIGNRKTLSALRMEDLTAFYQQVYHPATLVISVAGAVGADEVIDRLETALGGWRVNRPVVLPTVAEVETPDEIITEKVQIPGKAQVDLIWGVIGMPRTSPDYYPAVMGNLVLGRLGMMGRLGTRVRDTQGLAYYISSSVHVGLGSYPWTIMAGIAPENVDAAVQSTLEEVERLREEPIEDEELEDIRTYLTGALPLHLETNEGLAGFLMNIEEYGLGLDYLQRYPQIIYGVEKGEIQRVVRRYLTLDRYVLAMAGTFR